MARKSLTGQLNMFDLFKSLDNEPMGEVQMVSLMPEDVPEETPEPMPEDEPAPEAEEVSEIEPVPETEEVPEVEKIPEVETMPEVEPVPEMKVEVQPQKKPRVKKAGKTERPVMCRQYVIDGNQVEIAYINYNKVRITRAGEEPELYVFDSSKEAVDYYVQKMQELEPEE